MHNIIFLLLCFSLLFGFGEIPSQNQLGATYKPYKKIDLSRSGCINPTRLAVDSNYIYIVDDFTRTLYKCDQEGDLITKIDRINNEKFFPGGVAIDFDYVYLTDRDKGLIIKFAKTLDLQQVYLISVNSTSESLAEPQGMCIDTFHELYIADSGNNEVLKINALGQVEWTKGRFGYTPETLQDPYDVAVDQYLNVYVADNGSKSIKIYANQDQALISTISGFNDLRGICWSNNRLYAADYGAQAVQIYNNQNVLLNKLTDFENKTISPQDTYCLDNKLYVLDQLAKQVYVYVLE